MTIERKLSCSTVNFKDPYVLVIKFEDKDMAKASKIFRKLINETKDSYRGTWGYVPVDTFYVTRSDPKSYYDSELVVRAYVCFSDKEDALQFRLMCPVPSEKTVIWPHNLMFNMFVVTETE